MASIKLCYDDHIQNLSSGLQSMLNTSCFSDVTLAVDGQLFKAHQVILAMCSPYFAKLFMANDCHNNHVTVCILNVTHEIMQALLAFMYEGTMAIRAKDVDLLVTTANDLKIKGLEKSNIYSVTENKGNSIETNAESQEADNVALPLVAVKNECVNFPDVSLKKENDDMDLADIPNTLIENHQASSTNFAIVKPQQSAVCMLATLKTEVEDDNSNNKSIKGENDANMEFSHTEIQYPIGADDNDVGIEFDDFLDSNEDTSYMLHTRDNSDSDNDSIRDMLNSKMNEIADNNVSMSSSSCYDNTSTNIGEGDLVTVYFVKNNASQKNYSIIVNGLRYINSSRNTWLCSISYRTKCRARITLTSDKCIVFKNNHNHTEHESKQPAVMAFQETYTCISFTQSLDNCWKAEQISEAEETLLEASLSNGDLVTVSFFKSSRKEGWGGIIVNGVRYVKQFDQKEKLWSYWKCRVRTSHKCKAYIILTTDQHIVFGKQHNHAPLNKFSVHIDSERMYSVLLQETWREIKIKLGGCSPASTSDSISVSNNLNDDYDLNMHADSFAQHAEANLNNVQISLISQCDMKTEKSAQTSASYATVIGVNMTKTQYPTGGNYDEDGCDFEDSDIVSDYILQAKDSVHLDKNRQHSSIANKDCISIVSGANAVAGNVQMPSILQCEGENVVVSFLKTCKTQKSYSIMVNDVLYAPASCFRWRCPSSTRFRCRARIALTDDKHIVFIDEHNHAVQKETLQRVVHLYESYTIMSHARMKEAGIREQAEQTPTEASLNAGDSVTVSFLKSMKKEGWNAVIVNGMRYFWKREQKCKLWSKWQCSVHSTYNCKAYVILTKDLRIVFVKQHSHRQTHNRVLEVTDSQRKYTVLRQENWPDVKMELSGRSPKMRICEVEQTPTAATFASGEAVRVSFIKSLKKEGWSAIIVNDIRYFLKREQKFKLWSKWHCSVHSTHHCKAYVILTNDLHIVFVQEHNHAQKKRVLEATDLQCTYSVLSQETWHGVRTKWGRRSSASSCPLRGNDTMCHLPLTSVSNTFDDDDLNVHAARCNFEENVADFGCNQEVRDCSDFEDPQSGFNPNQECSVKVGVHCSASHASDASHQVSILSTNQTEAVADNVRMSSS